MFPPLFAIAQNTACPIGASPSRATVFSTVEAEYPLSQSIAGSRECNNARGCAKPWFNPAAFSKTPESQIPNGPGFLPSIRDGWLRPVDANLQKPGFLIERIRLPLQLRAFTGWNEGSFGGPSIITAGSVVDNARRAEAGAKVYF